MSAFNDLRNTEKTIRSDVKWDLASKVLRAAAQMADDHIAFPGETPKEAEERHERERRDAAIRKAVNVVTLLAVLCGALGALFYLDRQDEKEAQEEQDRQDRLDLYRKMSIRKGR